ncbi:hypothetical protein MMC09_002210 [Bachmanniomyces sp. S44760]|nr:hypothetical protein [Bachmanniomyces sp. S44760]
MTALRSLPLLYQLIILCLLFPFTSAYTSLSDDSLRALPDADDGFEIKNGKLLAPILRPRVPGTPGSTYVLNHFVDFFQTDLPKWNISFQNSTYNTRATRNKDVPFVNLIVSRDPPWTRTGEVGRLNLVAHYDSLQTPEGFIGATDSAAPCAMVMHAARSIDQALTRKWSTLQTDAAGKENVWELEDDEHQGIQILFLDGEEAFISWTDEDSTYGARSLAAEWENTPHAAMSTYRNPLSSISLFLLLDLLGSASPTVPSYFQTTHWAYQKMAELETRLRSVSRFKSSPNHPKQRSGGSKRAEPAFLNDAKKETGRWLGGLVQDDHEPFMQRGVEILHMIPSPFPRVWHEMDDDGDHLDINTVEDWATLVTAFAAEWLDLEGYMTPKSKRDQEHNEL